jgi:hypothetical protein
MDARDCMVLLVLLCRNSGWELPIPASLDGSVIGHNPSDSTEGGSGAPIPAVGGDGIDCCYPGPDGDKDRS